MASKPYPSAVSDDEWACVAPYLPVMSEEAPQRDYPLREVLNGLRWMVRAGAPWRRLPNDLPAWEAVSQHPRRWLHAGVFEAMGNELRQLLRLAAGRQEPPSGAIFDRRTRESSPESGARAGDDGAKRRQGSKVQVAVDSLGHLLALRVTPAEEQDRDQVAALAVQVPAVTGQRVEVAFVDQGSRGDEPLEAATEQGMRLEVVQVPQAKQGFVLLPRRWVVARRCAWTARCRCVARDDERLPQTLAGLHFVTFAMLLLQRFIQLVVHWL